MKKHNIQEAEFEEVQESKTKQTLPATLESLTLIRHNLSKGKTDKVIENISKELEIDKQLGLNNQAILTAEKSLEHDIDELTESRDYFQVSQKLLEKLFQIKKLQRKCVLSNIFSAILGFFKAGTLPLSLHAFMLLLIYPMLKFTMYIWPTVTVTTTAGLVSLVFFNIICWIGLVVLLFAGFSNWQNKKIIYTIMNIKVKMTPLSQVSDKIPYGAKLKVLEAKKTGIFQDFVYVSPNFEVNNRTKTISFPSVDPAILGVTNDKRMFMIVYWDIEKDVAKVVKEIEHFKKFKLHK